MTRKKAKGRDCGTRSTHQVSYTELKAESLRRFYADNKKLGEYVFGSPEAVRLHSVVRVSKLIKRFGEGPLKNLQKINLLRKAKAFLAGS